MFWTHPRSASEKCRLVWIDGVAMFTMDVSSRIINSIAASKTRAVQRFRAVVCIVCISFISFVRLAAHLPRAENHMEQVQFFLSRDVSLWFSMSISRHQQAASWPQGDQRLRDHAGPRQEAELIPGQDRRQDELRFGERKLVANTETWTSPKGEVRKAMAPGHPLRLEALRVEDIRPLPEVRMPVGRRRKQQDIRPPGDGIAPNLILSDGRTGKGPCRWIEAHRLLNRHTRKLELRQILHLRSAPTQDLLIFLSQPGFDVRMLREKHKGPAERVGRGLLTGRQKSHDLVTHLLVRHAKARLFILRLQEQGQQIALRRTFSAFLDQSVNDGINGGSRLIPAPALRGRQEEQSWHVQGLRFQAIDGARRLKHLLLVCEHVCTKERLAHNVQGQTTHLLEQIKGLLRLDFIKPGQGALCHQATPARDPLSMKDWLDQATLLPPGVSIVGQQAIAQRQAERLIGNPSLAVVEMILLEDMAYPIRMEDQRPRAHDSRQRYKIAVALAQFL